MKGFTPCELADEVAKKAPKGVMQDIDSSSDYYMFIRRLNNWANYRLKGGVGALSKGLRLK